MIEIRRPFLFAVASLLILSAPPTEATAQVSTSDVDAIFAAFSGPNTPGLYRGRQRSRQARAGTRLRHG